MNEFFEKFVKEIKDIKSYPCDDPYDLRDYKDERTKKILKDIDENKNHSWIKEIWERNKDSINDIAMKYRNSKITYKDFFTQSYLYATVLKKHGIKKGEKLLCLIENTPEFPFIMGAASILGIKVNLVSVEYENDYLEEIINDTESKYIFVSDLSLSKFSKMIKKHKEKNFVVIPWDNILKKNDPYKIIIKKYNKINEEEINNIIKEEGNIILLNDFLKDNKYNGYVFESQELNDEYTITYTSGSTGWKRPKALIHKVRSYITMGRYHDTKVSGIPSMKNRTTMAMIKTMSDTDFMTNISDTFMQGGIVALEPINDKEFFLISLLINKPTYAIASRSYWLYAMKQQIFNNNFKTIKLPFLFVPTAVGEPLAANEEKALNKWLKKLKAGIEITKLPFSITCMSTGGGDSEHGGIFISIFRMFQSKLPSHIGINEPIGMKTYDMVRVKALKSDGTYCKPLELGKLVASSPCNMKKYVNNKQANENFFIKDAYGKVWGNLNTYGYIDKSQHIYVKGRVSKNDPTILNFMVADVILKDTKKILSCEVINIIENQTIIYIAHIEPQINVSFNEQEILKSAISRCEKKFGTDFINSLYFRIRSNEESFELLHTGKRNNIALIEEGISSKCIKATELKEKEKIKELIKKKK